MRKWLTVIIPLWLVVILLAACVTLPDTGKQAFIMFTPQQEAQMGFAAFNQLRRSQKISNDPKARALVARVVNRITPHVTAGATQWDYEVFEDEDPNAFALPGGKIGVHTGLIALAENEAGLATVIGHECAHVSQRHGGQRMTQQMTAALVGGLLGASIGGQDRRKQQIFMQSFGIMTGLGILAFSRQHEREADALGLHYMAKAGYDPREALKFWQRMVKATANKPRPPLWLSSHPADSERIQRIQALIPQVLPIYEQSRM
ncbi:MAG: M48 family metallopeptidase [Methylacidiphilales bacterium]|nr:M48 family metallopeptidase [Candidatus Methylacidiphilales bacterium]MDW8349310.1 M48 family metallopeptidase [Verrucomicrobiae bacterium]